MEVICHSNSSSLKLDSIKSLVRLGCEAKIRPKMEALAKYLRELTNSES